MTARAYRIGDGAGRGVPVTGRTPADVLKAVEAAGLRRVRWPWGRVWVQFPAGWVDIGARLA